MGSRKRIVIVDDHPIVRQGMAAVLNRQPDLQVVGEADDVRSGYELIRATQPDVVVLDISLPGTSGMELLTRLHTSLPEVPVLMASMFHQEEYADRARESGARGYIMKQEASDRIVDAVRALAAGGTFFGTPAYSAQGSCGASAGIRQLTNSELEVLRLLGQGHSSKAIAELIHKSPKTVELYRARLRSKLGLSSANELIIFAGRWLSGAIAGTPGAGRQEPDRPDTLSR